jgi:hypothetical protein
MASYTANTTGNWNSSTTWSGAGIPGSGDTATINNGVTVTVPDGYTATVGTTGGTTGTVALTINGVLKIGVSTGGTLIAQGDIDITTACTSTPFVMNAGSTLEFLPASGQTIKLNNANSTTPSGGNVYGGNIVGTSASPCTVWTNTAANGGNNSYFVQSSWAPPIVNSSYCNYTNIGTSGTAMLTLNCANGIAINTVWLNNTFTGCGSWICSTSNQPTFEFENNIFSGSLGTGGVCFNLTFGNSFSSGTRQVTGNTFDIAITLHQPYGLTFNANVVGGVINCTDTATSAWASFNGNFITDATSGGQTVQSIGPITGNYFLKTTSGNVHVIVMQTNSTTNPVIDSNIFESLEGYGKCVLPTAMPTSGMTVTVTRNIVLPAYTGNVGCGAIVDPVIGGANPPTITCEHNTVYTGNSFGVWQSDDGENQPQGIWTSLRANLFWCTTEVANYSYKAANLFNPTGSAAVSFTTAATATASVSGGKVTTVAVNSGGSGYPASSTTILVSFVSSTGGYFASAQATSNSSGVITSITSPNNGYLYTSAPTVQVGWAPSSVDLGAYTAFDYNGNYNNYYDEPGDSQSGSYIGSGTVHAISGCANNGSGLIRVTTSSAHGLSTGNTIFVEGVTGTTEANNLYNSKWVVTVIDSTHVDLQNSAFSNTYVSGGRLCTTYPFAGNGYQCHFSGGFAGQHDVNNQNPGFVNSAANFGSWVLAQGQALSTDSYATKCTKGIAYLSANPAVVPAMLAWVRSGFAPTNSVYEAASYPGDTSSADASGNSWPGGAPGIGAMAWQPPPSPTTASGAATWSALVAAGTGGFTAPSAGSAFLGALVAAGSGTAAASLASTGTGAATWSSLLAAGTGTVTTTGTGAATWSALVAAGTGVALTSGSTLAMGAATLGLLTGLGLGQITTVATGAATWGAFVAQGYSGLLPLQPGPQMSIVLTADIFGGPHTSQVLTSDIFGGPHTSVVT